MIAKIFMESQDKEFIIDCLVLCEKEMGMLRVTKILKIGDKDSYIKNRTISEKDFFYVKHKDIVSIESENLKEYKETHPEYFL